MREHLELTRDEIKLLTGRHLDRAVMIHVCDIKPARIFIPDWEDTPDSDNFWWVPSGKPKRTHMIDATSIPHFSMSRDSCWEAEKFMRKKELHRKYADRLFRLQSITGDLCALIAATPEERCRVMLEVVMEAMP